MWGFQILLRRYEIFHNIDLLFTNIPYKETINISTNFLYNNEYGIDGMNKSEFKNLSLVTQESYFIFSDALYN